MKRFSLRQISLVITITMLFSLVGVAEDGVIKYQASKELCRKSNSEEKK